MDVIPIMKREHDGQVITQFDYPSCESLGLVKMDFLGLRNLTILDDAVSNVKINARHRPRPGRAGPRAGRPETYELLARGDTLGVFQFDGSATAPCAG